jgi:hypothetical protein
VTACEVLGLLDGFAELSGREQVDLIVYALSAIDGLEVVNSSDISNVFDSLRLPRYGRIPQYLSEEVRPVRGKRARYLRKQRGYVQSQPLADHCSQTLQVRKSKVIISKNLRDLLPMLPTSDAVNYFEEALGCFSVGFRRAAVVMSWCLTYDILRDWLFNKHLSAINAQLGTWAKPTTVRKIEDFDEMKERVLIDTANKAGILSKELNKSLIQLLDDRNSYAHASGKPITDSIAEAYIERAVHHAIAEMK